MYKAFLKFISIISICLISSAAVAASETIDALFSSPWQESDSSRIHRWQSLINTERSTLIRSNGRESQMVIVERVNRLFNAVPYMSDEENWQQTDYWASPLQMLTRNRGDCEDYAVAKYFTLRAIGIPMDQLKIGYVRAAGQLQPHMVLMWQPDWSSEPLVLDNLVQAILPVSRRNDLTYVYGFNERYIWAGDLKSPASADSLKLWKDLKGRVVTELATQPFLLASLGH